MKCNPDGTSVLNTDETLALIVMVGLLNEAGFIPPEWGKNLYDATSPASACIGRAGNPTNFSPE